MKRPDLYRAWIAAETEDRLKVRTPSDVMPAIAKYAERKTEHFIVVLLNGAHEVMGKRAVTKGTANRTMVHPREVFRYAITRNAVAVILAHNHPSGNTEPSAEDDEITKRLVDSGQLLGIPVLDHVIVSGRGYFSYTENDRLHGGRG